MSSSGPSNTGSVSNANSTLTDKQLADSFVEAQNEYHLKYAKAQRHFDEDREKDPEDYERDVEPFQTQFFAGEEGQKKMEAILSKIRSRMVKENEDKAKAEASGGK
ncbi:MAG: hypothetical protein Q9169_002145 [Polycauliona sp. 2 TL-2023]